MSPERGHVRKDGTISFVLVRGSRVSDGLGFQFLMVPYSLKVGLGIGEFCAISRRLISKIRFPHPISVADAICGTRFDLRDSKRRALEN